MATISNTPRPGYVWDSTDNVWYPIGVGGHSHPDYITQATAVNPTIIDAKGDIITATAADTPARLAVGNNGETLVADSSTSTGLRYQGSMAAGKNFIVGGNFDIWQRGTSFASPANLAYLSDRFYNNGSGGTNTVAQETTVIQDGSQYSLKITAGAATSFVNVASALELASVAAIAGQTVTLSAYVRANATYSGNVVAKISTNTTANTIGGGTWTALATGTATAPSTSAWTRISVTATVPSGTQGLRIELNNQSSQASGAILYWSQVQLEIGSVPTTFTRAGGTIQGELAACQRYYVRLGGAALYEAVATGAFESATNAVTMFQCPVTLRAAATSVEYSTIYVYDYGAVRTITNVTINNSGKNVVNLSATVTGGTQYRPFRIETNNSLNGYLAVSAEL